MPEEIAAPEVIDIFGTLAGASGPAIVPAAFGAEAAAAAAAGAGAGGGVLQGLKDVATVLTPVASIVGTAGGIQASRSMSRLGGALPMVPPPVAMPILGSPQTLSVMRSNIQEQLVRRGRAASILTAPSGEKLGS